MYASIYIYIYTYVYIYIYKYSRHLARALAFATFQRSAVSLPPLRVLPSIAMDDFIDLFAATILNRDFSGLAAGWLLFFKLNITLFFINFHFTGLAAGWLLSEKPTSRRCSQTAFPWPAAGWPLPCCDKDAQFFPGEVHRIQQFTGLSAGLLLSLCEKGEQFLVVKLATFDYTGYFLNLLTVALTFFTYSAKVQASQFLSSATCFTRFAKVHGLSLPTCPFCPLDPPSWLPCTFVWGIVPVFCQLLVLFYGWFFLFYFRSLFFFQLVKSIGSIRKKAPTNLLKRSSMPLHRQDQIKSKSPESLKSKLHRPHFPSSTVSIFQAPPIPFSRLHHLHFPSSTVPIFQAPPYPFSKLHRPQPIEVIPIEEILTAVAKARSN